MRSERLINQVRLETDIDAPAETIFALLTDPEQIPRWWPLIRTFEPRVGGRFAMGSPGWLNAGEVREFEAPRSFAYTWRTREHPSGIDVGHETTEVRWVVAGGDDPDADAAASSVELMHSGFRDAEKADAHAAQWERYLTKLKAAAEAEARRPDRRDR
jgi:uncharacterized protein YndB with AHSA1/START domain